MKGRNITYNRHSRILDLLKERGSVTVDDLAEELDVSSVTVRRDLDILDRRGFLTRTHGGAKPLRARMEAMPERMFSEKDGLYVAEKQKIAERATQLIGDDEIVFMNSGSTVLFFLRALRNKRIRIITNNAAALQCERDRLVELMILGGEYRQESRSLVGEIPLKIIQDIFSSHTILGTNGLDLERGLTTSVYQECSINKAMINNTHGKVIVLADHTKMGFVSNFVSASLDRINIVITDEKCPPLIRSALEKRGIEVILA
jgi:DeoR/GlpR family transcriptional regulator of sugar metabolism